MSFLEICLTIMLGLWALGSLLYQWRGTRLHRRLARFNRALLLANWGVFLTSDSTRRAGTFELEFRDGAAVGSDAPWRRAAGGHCWSWRAFLWLPERYRAAAIQNLGRQMKTWLARTPPDEALAAHNARILGAFLWRRHPPQPGVPREIRLVKRFASGTAPDEEVWVFPRSTDAAGD